MFENSDLIHRYTRADALCDCVLIDVSGPGGGGEPVITVMLNDEE